MFYGDFGSEGDVCREFAIKQIDGVVIYAAYDIEGWDGFADVVFVSNGKFYMVSGSHCSCHGLEGQWGPVEMPIAALRKMVESGSDRYKEALVHALAVLDRMNLDGCSDDVIQVAIKLSIG